MDNSMNKNLHTIVKTVGEELRKKKLHLAVAESCTGGLVAAALTTIAGASNFFACGFVTYSNQAKEKILDVHELTLHLYGAVSENTAAEMAKGAMLKAQAQVGLAVTGIAGPSGGSARKPVGTVCFAWSQVDRPTYAATKYFEGDRDSIREQAVTYALERLLEIIKN